MASTSSQASTSLQPSSTSDSNTNNQMINNTFSANGSPTLVVAFLAIGLFTVVMAAMFGWRKMHRGRLSVQPIRPPRDRPGKKPIVLGEKPTLWDMWTRREEEEATINLEWENITVRQAPQSLSNIVLIMLLARRWSAFLRHAVLSDRRTSSAGPDESHRATTSKSTPFIDSDECF